MSRSWLTLGILAGICLSLTKADSAAAAFECPYGWEDFEENCYRFVRDPMMQRELAKVECAVDGAYLLSINSDREHNFVIQTLEDKDPGQIKQSWWTSGRRMSGEDNIMEFYWEGDGTELESYIYWHNNSIPQDLQKTYIMYYYDGFVWAWILGVGSEQSPFVCEISKDDIYKIQQEERGPGYGIDNINAETIPRGPKFILQPEDTVFESNVVNKFAVIECEADAYPPATYQWFRERADQSTPIDPAEDARYTIINGKLMLHDPTEEGSDDGNYQCTATNMFGTIYSNKVSLTFGYLLDFPKSERAPVEAIQYQWTSIECNPPDHYPDIQYSWIKDGTLIRTEYKPYIMISHDGRLYFSEVTTDDVGQYKCLVQMEGRGEGKVSEPTELRVLQGSPGSFEPRIGSGFPLVFPSSPKIGDTVRIECWAHGSAAPGVKLEYNWHKVEVQNDDSVIELTLPIQATMIDNKRVLVIPNIQLYDSGVYRCASSRQHGLSTNKTVQVNLQSVPYFILALNDQFADINSPLKWRCEAGGEPAPTYFWLKNGQVLDNSSIPSDDRDRVFVYNNVLEFVYLDPEKDDGMYQCSARNMHGTGYSTGELRVLSFEPNFNKYPLQANQFATEEGNTTMICKPEAAPYPEYEAIIWRKDGVIIGTGDPDSGARITKLQNGNLFISPVRDTDQGRYQCLVENPLGSAYTEGNLTVLSTTSISQGPLNTVIQVNRTSFLHCVASYNPKLDVTYIWYHGDYLIEFEKVFRLGENRYEVWYHPHFRRGSGVYLGGLYIMRAQYEHAGLYTCEIQSASGGMKDDAQVYINGPPSEPAGVQIVSGTITTTSVQLRWKTGGANGEPIISFVVEGINEYEGFWKVLETNVMETPDNTEMYYYNVTKLRPYSMYELRMRAENVLGTSEPSVESSGFGTLGTKPDLAPTYVGGGGGRVGDLVITWTPLNPWEYNAAGLGYRVHWKNAGDDEWDGIKDVYGTSRYVTLVGENNFYREYDVAVQSFNDIGDGPISANARIRSAMALPPATAQDVRVQPWNATACLVHWEPVSDTRESMKGKLGGYRISYWRECCETEEMAPRLSINGQAEEALVIGLYPNTPYYFDVMVWNEAGNGPKSQFFIQRTLRSSPINPPVEVKLTRRSDTAIHVSWRGVSTTSVEEPLEGYAVRIWPSGSHIKVAKDYDAVKETDLYIDDLHPDETYKLRVLGYSRGGDGTMSSPSITFQLGSGNGLHVSFLVLLLCTLLARWTIH